MQWPIMSFGIVAAAALTASTPALAAGGQCFRSSEFRGFKPAGDRAMIVRAGVSDFYRVEFAQSCRQITYPGAMLVTRTRGSDMICSGVDWNLEIGDNGNRGFSVPCIVASQRKLTKAEVAALPKGQRP
jgi:hypothetical protein